MVNSNFENIAKSFSSDYQNLHFEETFDQVELEFEGSNLYLPDIAVLNELFFFLPSRDTFLIIINIDDSPTQYLQSGENSYNEFLQDCMGKYDVRENKTIKIKISINKSNENGIISVYSIQDFEGYLENQTIKGFLFVLSKCFAQNGFIVFEIQDETINLKTKSIWFVNKKIEFKPEEINFRELRTHQSKNTSYNKILTDYDFIPEDFIITVNINSTSKLVTLLHKMELLYSFFYLCDFTEINENSTISYKWNGYKSVSATIDIKDIDLASHAIYSKIYDWTYTGGNIYDKINLARNIISLHLNVSTLNIPESTFHSVQSNFSLYLKENIRQYIDIRNKIFDQLLNFKDRADKIIDNFAGDFKKSLLAFVSFYATVIVIRVVSKGDFAGAFTLETTILSLIFLLITLLIMLASKWELKKQSINYKETYQNLKDRYSDLLNRDDINKILNNDNDFSNNIKYINEKEKIYTRIWIASLILIFLVTLVLYDINNNHFLLNKIKDVIYGVCQHSIPCSS
jgi:hypothetical protein